MEAIGLSCPKLRKFYLKVKCVVTARDIIALVSGYGSCLRELAFYDCVAIDKETTRAIPDHCKHLEALTMRACTSMDDTSPSVPPLLPWSAWRCTKSQTRALRQWLLQSRICVNWIFLAATSPTAIYPLSPSACRPSAPSWLAPVPISPTPSARPWRSTRKNWWNQICRGQIL